MPDDLSSDTRLIILRGPCGAGKSTVASRLLDSPRPTALIEQDPYRFIFNVREGEAYSRTVRQMNPGVDEEPVLVDQLQPVQLGRELGPRSSRERGEQLVQLLSRHGDENLRRRALPTADLRAEHDCGPLQARASARLGPGHDLATR